MVRKQTFAEISERCAAVNASLWDFEMMTTVNGVEAWQDMLLVYRVEQPSCFSWEPGSHELLALFLRDHDDYYSIPVQWLPDEQLEKLFDEICGENEEYILQRERHLRRLEHNERKRSA
jgi:hypothetical protein